MLLTGILASSILVFQVRAQSAASTSPQAPSAPVPANKAPRQLQPAPYMPKRAIAYYGTFWGIEDPIVKVAESGELIRFSYTVIDADKAKTLNNKELAPVLIDPEAGVQLVVPALEQVGSLRQTSTPIAGKTYWMAFSNPGRPVKRGHRVDVVIGPFRAPGLIVQ